MSRLPHQWKSFAPADSTRPKFRTAASSRPPAASTYAALLREGGGEPGQIDEFTRSASRSFLIDQIDAAGEIACDFPEDVRSLAPWLEQKNREAARLYRQYLVERRAGSPRRFFSNRSHALHFLRAVAPTKLVDGAWLYGLLSHWNDSRFRPLIRIYLDELGLGRPEQNHVWLYRELLSRNGLDTTGGDRLADEYFVQGAIQLALAHHSQEFLPELIGFNLGYEQLPLHLPITAHELAEFDIDPYYFTLHVTVDNAGSGHARQALDGLMAAWPRLDDGRAFFARVANGYRLNELGIGTTEMIGSFNLENELLAMLSDKASFGALLHSDHCRVAGATVTEWLTEPRRLPDFLRALEGLGWIRHGQPPENSRFWKLLHDDGAPMFGVFNTWEQALIADWIVGAQPDAANQDPSTPSSVRTPRRFRRRVATSPDSASPFHVAHDATVSQVLRHHLAGIDRTVDADDFDVDRRLFADRLSSATTRSDAMKFVLGLLSPANHASPVGLLATRIYADLLAARD